jgi:tRNA (guanine-N7-)-methyltransferase
VIAEGLNTDIAQAERCEVEIGCGNGHFLCQYAGERPDSRLIGIDIKEKRCIKAREKMEKRGLRNVSILHGSAETFLHSVPPDSMDAFHVYFPDPWPKSKHRKRRFFTMENLDLIHAALKRGGRLYFGTDFFDYYMQAKVLVALHEGLHLTEEPAPEAVLISLYGRKATGSQKTIHLFCAVKQHAEARPDSSDHQGEEQEEERQVHGHVHEDEEA